MITYTGGHVKTNGGGGATTSGVFSSLAADCIACAVSQYAGRTTDYSLSDSLGNVYTQVAPWYYGTDSSFGAASTIFVCIPTALSATHQILLSGVSAFGSIAVACFAGVTPSGYLDGYVTANNNGTPGTTLSPGAYLPTVDGCLLLAALGAYDDSGNTVSIDSSFTITDSQLFVSGGGAGVSLAYKIQSTRVSVTPQWTNGSTSVAHLGAALAAIKALALAPPPGARAYPVLTVI